MTSRKLKVVLLGVGVGKTNFALRVANDTFINNHRETQGLEVHKTELAIKDQKVEVNLFDTNVEAFYKNTDGFVILYDVCNKDSFASVSKLLKRVKEYDDEVPILIFGTKTDLTDQRQVQTVQGKELSTRYKCQFGEGSSKTNSGVHESFSSFIQLIMEKIPKEESHEDLSHVNSESNKEIHEKLAKIRQKELVLEREKMSLLEEKKKLQRQLGDELVDDVALKQYEHFQETPGCMSCIIA
jgi:small GTP-binding protein